MSGAVGRRHPSGQHARWIDRRPRTHTFSLAQARWEHGWVLFDGVSHQLPDVDPGETVGVARRLRRRRRRPRTDPGPLPADADPRACRAEAGRLPGHRLVALRQHHPLRRGARVPRGRVPRAADPGLHPLERRGDGGAGQRPLRGHRRPPVHLRQLGLPLRGGLQPLLPGQGRRAAPGDQVYFQGHASPGIYARAFVEGRLSEEQLDNFRFEVGGGGPRALVLPPSRA